MVVLGINIIYPNHATNMRRSNWFRISKSFWKKISETHYMIFNWPLQWAMLRTALLFVVTRAFSSYYITLVLGLREKQHFRRAKVIVPKNPLSYDHITLPSNGSLIRQSAFSIVDKKCYQVVCVGEFDNSCWGTMFELEELLKNIVWMTESTWSDINRICLKQ